MIGCNAVEAGADAARTDSQRQRFNCVMSLAQEGEWEEGHSLHVTTLALSLFDQLCPMHGLGPKERELLHYGGLLHDIGYRVSVKKHHKHAYDIITGSLWPGFSDWEVQVMAAVARYHRKRMPKNKDRELADLNAGRKYLTRVLAGILRVADGMDRTHLSMVRQVRAMVENDRLVLVMEAGAGAELELHYALKKSDLLAATLQISIRARLEAPVMAEPAG